MLNLKKALAVVVIFASGSIGTTMNAAASVPPSTIVIDSSQVAMPQFSEVDPGLRRCLSMSNSVDGRIDCIAMSQENLNNVAESNYSEALKACGKYYDPSSCHLAVKRAHDAYLYYFDQMRVVFSTLNANNNDKGLAMTDELILSITAMHARLLEEAIKSSQPSENITIK